MENQQSARPKPVALAVGLLWASIAIGLAKIPLDLPAMSALPHQGIIWSVVALVLAFYCLLIFKIGAGRNWARITFGAIFVVTMIMAVPTLVNEFARAPAVGFLLIAQALMQGYALYLVFTSPGKDWFRKQAAG